MVLDQDYRPTVLLYEIVIYLYASRTSSPCRDYIINTNTMQTGILNRKAIILYLVLVLGYSYLFGVLELIFKNGVFYDFLGKSFTFVPVITALVLNKKVEKNTGGRMSLKVWKNPKALAASAFAPGILIAMGAVLYFLVFPNEYSGVFAMGNLFEGRENTAISNPFMFVLITTFPNHKTIHIF